jgi:hypothetical protein
MATCQAAAASRSAKSATIVIRVPVRTTGG